MTDSFQLYVQPEDLSILSSEDPKTFLLGGDFGYGNFGDILQCCNSIAFHRRVSDHRLVVVLAVDAIVDSNFVNRARKRYNVDAVVYVSRSPLCFKELCPVAVIRNAVLLHFYGGGVLNVLWGSYVLGVAAYLHERLRPAGYVISGQQVSAPLHFALIDHCRIFRPLLVGVRDRSSLALMKDASFDISFSFDDACESLLLLARRLPLLLDHGLIIHLNLSSYTQNLSSGSSLRDELQQLAADGRAQGGLTVCQAFESRQFDVCDSFESIKQLSFDFPFCDYRVLDLVRLIDNGCGSLGSPIKVGIGYSCSYHVALWLQLAGIPCWLRSGSSFYSQKRESLQVRQTLGEFLAAPHLADHCESLHRREEWLVRLEQVVRELPLVSGSSEVADSRPEDAPAWMYRGRSTPMARMAELVDAQRLELGDFSERVVALSRTTSRLGRELHERNHAFWLLQQDRDQLQADRDHVTRRLHATLPERCKWFVRRQVDRLRRKFFPPPGPSDHDQS